MFLLLIIFDKKAYINSFYKGDNFRFIYYIINKDDHFRYIHHIINKGIEGGEDICREIINSIISFVRVTVVSWIKSIGGWVSRDRNCYSCCICSYMFVLQFCSYFSFVRTSVLALNYVLGACFCLLSTLVFSGVIFEK